MPVWWNGRHVCLRSIWEESRAGSSPVAGTMYDAKWRDRQRADEKRRVLREYLVKTGCVECGYNEHYAALEFDHLPGQIKYKNVMAMCYDSWDKIWTEVSKCEVVCSNHHSIRTHERNGSLSQLVEELGLDPI